MVLFSNDKQLQAKITRLSNALQQASANTNQQANKIVTLQAQIRDMQQRVADNAQLNQKIMQLQRENHDYSEQVERYKMTEADLTKQLRDALVHSEVHEMAEQQIKNPYRLDNELWHILEGSDSTEQHNYIYQLRLADGTYYVGQTHNLRQRIQTHFNEQISDGIKSSAWVRQHGAKQLIGLSELVHQEYAGKDIDFIENLTTLKLMAQYGYQNVRGGVFSQAKTDDVLQALKRTESQKRFGYQLVNATVMLKPKPAADTTSTSLMSDKPKASTKISSLVDAPQTGYHLTDENITDDSYILLVGQLNDQRYVAFTRRKKTLAQNVANLFTGDYSFLKTYHVHLTRIVNTYHIFDHTSAEAYATVKAFTMAKSKHYHFLEDPLITDKLAATISTILSQRRSQHDTLAQHVKLH